MGVASTPLASGSALTLRKLPRDLSYQKQPGAAPAQIESIPSVDELANRRDATPARRRNVRIEAQFSSRERGRSDKSLGEPADTQSRPSSLVHISLQHTHDARDALNRERTRRSGRLKTSKSSTQPRKSRLTAVSAGSTR